MHSEIIVENDITTDLIFFEHKKRIKKNTIYSGWRRQENYETRKWAQFSSAVALHPSDEISKFPIPVRLTNRSTTEKAKNLKWVHDIQIHIPYTSDALILRAQYICNNKA